MSLGRHWKVFAIVAIAVLLSHLAFAQEYDYSMEETETTSSTPLDSEYDEEVIEATLLENESYSHSLDKNGLYASGSGLESSGEESILIDDGSGISSDGSGISDYGSGLSVDGSGISSDGSGISSDGSGISDYGSGLSVDGSGISSDGSGISSDGSGISDYGSGLSVDGSGISTDGSGLVINAAGISIEDSGLSAESSGVSADGSGISTDGSGISTDGSGLVIDVTGISIEDSGLSAESTGVSADASGVSADGSGVSADGSGVSADGSGVYANSSGVYDNDSGVFFDGSGVSANGSGVSADGSGVSADGSGVSADGSGFSVYDSDLHAEGSGLSGEGEIPESTDIEPSPDSDGSGTEESKLLESDIRENNDDKAEVDDKQIKNGCEHSEFGCCSDEIHPAHGPDGLGCCAYSNFTCCPDNLTPALGPYGEGCDCKNAEFGCCPDDVTPAKAANFQGCGCQYEEFGCCPDRTTKASGPEFEGCGCETHPYGCCPDGQTPAEGSNLEGCPACNSPDFGCCPDGVTPKLSENDHCECHSMNYGCCPDGETPASGPLLKGCGPTYPGEECVLASKTGTCTNYEPKWYYDLVYGGCSRFWYGGCDPGGNHFDAEDSCKETCVSPRASAVCFLRKNEGPCDGKYNEWYFDRATKRCLPFVYGGCLGNGNRFQTKGDCENLCLADSKMDEKDGKSLCDKAKAEGPCRENYPRYFYNSASGQCEQFYFSGCMGNNNRFMTLEECNHVCMHKAKEKLTDRVCSLPLDSGNCTITKESFLEYQAKWAYERQKRRCLPFYFSGCGGNENAFQSKEDCEAVCPTVYPPIVSIIGGEEMLLERGSESPMIRASVRANPPAIITWKHNGRIISHFDDHFSILPDASLRIDRVSDMDSGTYTIEADNGIGSAMSRDVIVTIFPLYSTVDITLEKSIFKPEEEVIIPCSVKGYPPPEISWHKVLIVRGRRKEVPIVEERPRLSIETFQLSTTTATSRLIIRNSTVEDGGVYKCLATSSVVPDVSDSEGIKVQEGPGSNCTDRPSYSHCDKVIKHRFCGNRYYGQYCCKSCTKAGFLPGGLY